MKLVKPSFEIIEQEVGREGLLRHIEKCGRTCYKSEDKITEDSAEKFVNMIINRGHTAMLEHGTIYLYRRSTEVEDDAEWFEEFADKYSDNKYSNATRIWNDNKQYEEVFVTTNYRVLLQNDWTNDLQYLCEPTEYHEKRITVKFVCDRGVSHEFVRHRVFSFAQESTRYCNYSKDKFGNECTFIIPSWLDLKEGLYECFEESSDLHDFHANVQIDNNTWYRYSGVTESDICHYLRLLDDSQEAYLNLLSEGWIAQQARAVLPNSLKTELVMTGTIDQWKGFFKLRDDEQHAHPQAYELAHPLHEEFIKRGYITE